MFSVCVCFPIESVVSQVSVPSASPLLTAWELSVSFGEMDCGRQRPQGALSKPGASLSRL